MTEEVVAQFLIAVIPALTAIVSVVGIACKILHNLTDLKSEFSEKTDYREIQKAMGKLIDENQALNKEIKRLNNKINHVYGGEENVEKAVGNNKKV